MNRLQWLILLGYLIISSKSSFSDIDPDECDGKTFAFIKCNQLSSYDSEKLRNQYRHNSIGYLPLPETYDNNWFIGDNAKNGLCNQLFGVYSQVSAAFVFNTSLVVGDIYSRYSFENYTDRKQNWLRIPFSSFFDWDHFSNIWTQRGLRVVQFRDHEHYIANRKVTVILREPKFGPNKEQVLFKMLAINKIPFPIPANTILAYSNETHKVTGLFNFWKGGMRVKRYRMVLHKSFLPSKEVRDVLGTMLRYLPNGYIAAHLRIEGDYLEFENLNFEDQLQLSIKNMINSTCLRTWERKNDVFINPPALFLACGLFGNPRNSSFLTQTRAKLTIKALKKLGFTRIYHRLSLLRLILKDLRKRVNDKKHGKTLLKTKQYEDKMDLMVSKFEFINIQTDINGKDKNKSFDNREFRKSLFTPFSPEKIPKPELLSFIKVLEQYRFSRYPEQEAWLDFLISRMSRCFCPSHVASSFSYMVLRLKYADAGIIMKIHMILEKDFGVSWEFRDWGF